MNVLAAALALAVLAAAQDPRAFKMPKKAKPAETLPVTRDPLPVQPAATAPAVEPAKPQNTIMFELPKTAPKTEAARATGNGERATPPAEKRALRKKSTSRTFRLPDKNDVSN